MALWRVYEILSLMIYSACTLACKLTAVEGYENVDTCVRLSPLRMSKHGSKHAERLYLDLKHQWPT